MADWQVFVHYWDLLVDRDWYDVDTPAVLREMYAGKRVTVALAHGPAGTDTPALVLVPARPLRPLPGRRLHPAAPWGTEQPHRGPRRRAPGGDLVHSPDDPAATSPGLPARGHGADRSTGSLTRRRAPCRAHDAVGAPPRGP
ncbi:hypothetical protein ACGRHY_27745 [Streptomyces sp. HK10]|uniref:hypothetical protein n=1 Tax=Streptomyces sp. HK10 TaxID=3373255 RepID=UPI0037489BF6